MREVRRNVTASLQSSVPTNVQAATPETAFWRGHTQRVRRFLLLAVNQKGEILPP
ncbi:MAG: hypothetical protein JWM30_2780 [Burkholderia sp.]|nr:hypothetical protein [Burkholderia sp.]